MSDLDLEALRAYLARRLPYQGSFALEVQRIRGGQSNPTWFVTWGDRRLVLRKKPAGSIVPGAHAVEREYRVMRALEQTKVPVPRCFLLEEDHTVLGTSFYLMERLEGRVFSDCSLPGLRAPEREAIYYAMAETLATLHAVRPDTVGLSNYGPSGNYFERQIARWSKQYQASEGPRIPELDRLVDLLPGMLPSDDGEVAIAHGDFRLGNLMFHPTEPRVIAVLDWELSTLGHPLADLGFCVMPWRSLPEEYGGILGLDREALGIPSEARFVEHYFRHARHTAPLLPFHVAFALFRFSVIFVGITGRVRSGTATDSEAARLSPLAERFAVRALQAAEGGPH